MGVYVAATLSPFPTYVCDHLNFRIANSLIHGDAMAGGGRATAGKYLRLTYTNIAGDEGCVFKNLHRYILIKVS